jgi:DNA-binding transcriptional ArsR family regulator
MRFERLSDEEEAYSTIFTALRYTIRRRILRMLAGKSMTFTELLNRLGSESSHLTYHLDSLGVLLAKAESGKYQLSTFGQAAVSMMGWVEETPKIEPKPGTVTRMWKTVLVLLVVGIAVFSGAYYSHYHLSEFYLNYSRLSRNFTQIKEEYLSTIAPTAISPPISKLEAIHLALEHDGWNKTTLEGMLVNAKLCYVELTVSK